MFKACSGEKRVCAEGSIVVLGMMGGTARDEDVLVLFYSQVQGFRGS